MTSETPVTVQHVINCYRNIKCTIRQLNFKMIPCPYGYIDGFCTTPMEILMRVATTGWFGTTVLNKRIEFFTIAFHFILKFKLVYSRV